MAVNLSVPSADALLAIEGVQLHVGQAGIKKANHNDVTLLTLSDNSQVAGVFTRNRFCAAPVVVSQNHLAQDKPIKALVINTGNANAGTGQSGRDHALAVCAAVAKKLDCAREQVLPFSTGVILEPLPVAKIEHAISHLQAAHWDVAAAAIMTTDTVAKAGSRTVVVDGHEIHLSGMAKGSGMIHPNMATLLGFIATDAAISQQVLQQMVREAADDTFNSITVDGDTSTNDSFMLVATGKTSLPEITQSTGVAYQLIQAAVTDLALELAQAIVRDGEGATKFITVAVEGAKDKAEAKQVGYAIARSPLVKTAFFASDPNLGRLLCAIGYAGVDDLDVDNIEMYLGDVLVAEKGGRALSYQEEDGQKVMAEPEIVVKVILNRGTSHAKIYTCDFSYDYVKINAEYRS